MGWSGANDIFDPVARELLRKNMAQPDITDVLAVLIKALQDGDWDTEDESLAGFARWPEVVEAFRRNGIVIKCGSGGHDDDRWCEREQLPRGHDDGHHESWNHTTWPVTDDERAPG